ncbi:MAG: aspartate aminotransferase family protein [Deltaproteobacteria bacterium]|nr:aspartate aminotransferase family protein [Deltaproteobacteria bacterium]
MSAQEHLLNEIEDTWNAIEKHAWIPWVSMAEVARKRQQPIIRKGEGVYLEDLQGKRYLDASSGPVAVNYGYGNTKIAAALKDQLSRLHFLHYRVALAEVVADLCRKIAQYTPGNLNRVHLNVTGSDAVEGALKIARAYFDDTSKNKVISLYGSYHGLSYGTLSVTGFSSFKDPFRLNVAPGGIHVPPPYCYRCPYGLAYPTCGLMCAKMIDRTIEAEGPDVIAAFIGEPIMGVGGVITPPKDYWPMVREICDKHDVLLIIDEVMSGWARTGKLFACEHWDIEPDMITMAKGLSGVYQSISAIAVHDRIFEKLRDKKLYHSHTQSCSPLACAAALAAIDLIENENLAERAAEKGRYLRERLEELKEDSPLIGDVRGKGLFQGIELVSDRDRKLRFTSRNPELRETLDRAFLERGMIIRLGGYDSDTLYFTPPLIIENHEIDRICEITREVLGELDRLS